MGFRRNYLPSQSQPWTREVQSRVEAMERDVVLSDINNRTRDDQLQSSYNRLDSAFVTLANQQTTLESQQTELTTVSGEADTALQTAITANGLAVDAIQDVVNLSSPGGPSVNASNVTAGSINGLNITGGTLATAGLRHVEISGTSTLYFDESNNFTGKVTGLGTANGAALELSGPGSGLVSIWSSGVVMYGGGGSIAALSSNGFGVGGNKLYTFDNQNIEAGGSLISGGTITRTQLAGGGTTGASITSGGNLVRTSSSERYKADIENAEFSLEAVLQLQPKTFRLKEEVEEDPENALVYPGFIAEDIAGTDLDVFVNYENLPDGTRRPDGVRYGELTAALVSAMKQQNETIKTLEARLDALEAK